MPCHRLRPWTATAKHLLDIGFAPNSSTTLPSRFVNCGSPNCAPHNALLYDTVIKEPSVNEARKQTLLTMLPHRQLHAQSFAVNPREFRPQPMPPRLVSLDCSRHLCGTVSRDGRARQTAEPLARQAQQSDKKRNKTCANSISLQPQVFNRPAAPPGRLSQKISRRAFAQGSASGEEIGRSCVAPHLDEQMILMGRSTARTRGRSYSLRAPFVPGTRLLFPLSLDSGV